MRSASGSPTPVVSARIYVSSSREPWRPATRSRSSIQPDHGVTMLMRADAYHRDNSLARRLLDAPQLHGGWREWAIETAAKLDA